MGSATLIGLGNIGAALAPLIARMPGISAITLVDPDVYSESNLSTQAIDGAALGKPKVAVQAALISAINPQISVEPIQNRVENVPLAVLRSSVVIACVDNRRARQTINRIAWRCGSPWIDAAVDAPSLVRVNAYMPGESACIECGWTAISYELLEQDYACDVGSEISVSATAAPAELGTLAAALQAAELRKLLSGATNGASLVGAQVMLDTATHMTHLTRFERSENCKFDHQTWEIDTSDLKPRANTLADAFDAVDGGPGSALRLEGHTFAIFLDCVACCKRTSVGPAIYSRLSAAARTCECGGWLFATGFFSFDALQNAELSVANRQLKLADVGLRAGDVVSITDAAGIARHLEIGGKAAQ